MNGAVTAFYLGAMYMLWNLGAFYRLMTVSPADTARAKRIVVVSLVVLALWWEQWLDFAVFLGGAIAFLWWASARVPRIDVGRLRFSAISLGVVVASYLAIKLPFAREHVVTGKESELIVNYLLRDGLSPSMGISLAADDVFTAALSNLYLTLTNYVPPAFLPGDVVWQMTPQEIVSTQHGYHPQMAHLVYFHNIFLWYLTAGLLAGLFFAATVRAAVRARQTGDEFSAVYVTVALLVFTGSATHWLIKYRPYLSLPFLHYKVLASVVGVTVLLAILFTRSYERAAPRRRPLLALAAVFVLLLGALTKPAELSGMSQALSMSPMPSPVASAAGLGPPARALVYTLRWHLGLAAPPPVR